MKTILILSLVLLSGCATSHVTDLGNDKFIAIANDTTGLLKVEDSIENAKLLAYQKCGARSVVVDSIVNRDDSSGLPETTLTFHCK